MFDSIFQLLWTEVRCTNCAVQDYREKSLRNKGKCVKGSQKKISAIMVNLLKDQTEGSQQ